MPAFELDQVTALPVITLPVVSRSVAVSGTVVGTTNPTVGGLTTTDTTGRSTLICARPTTRWLLALTVTESGAIAVRRPPDEMVARVESDVDHVMA
jgi:hypothetical protein